MSEPENTQPVPHPDALFTELPGGEGVLLSLETHAYYGLNSTGVRIWRMISQGLTVNDICAALEQEFGDDGQDVRGDLAEFLRELSAAKLLQPGAE